MNFNDGNLNFTPDKTIPLDVWQNKEFSFGLGVPNVSEAQKQIKYLKSLANTLESKYKIGKNKR